MTAVLQVLPMTFPQAPIVTGTNSGSLGTSAAASYNAPLPSNIVAGELLMVFVAAGAGSSRTVSTPSGWTQLFNTPGDRNVRAFACFYKTASGSEGSTVTITASASSSWASTSYRIALAQGSPEAGSSGTGTSTNPDAPSFSPSWGAANTLWIAAAARDNAQGGGDFTAAPSGYSNMIQGNAGPVDTNYQAVATAEKRAIASSDDPGAFTSSSAGWIAKTVAVRPY